jgi:hypothetical protein
MRAILVIFAIIASTACSHSGISTGEVMEFNSKHAGINCQFGKKYFNVYHVEEKGDKNKGSIYFYETAEIWRIDYYSLDNYMEKNGLNDVSLEGAWNDLVTKLHEQTGRPTYTIYKDNGEKGDTNTMRTVVEVKQGHKGCLSCVRTDLWYGAYLDKRDRYIFITYVEQMGDDRLKGEKKEEALRDFVRWSLQERASQCVYQDE